MVIKIFSCGRRIYSKAELFHNKEGYFVFVYDRTDMDSNLL